MYTFTYINSTEGINYGYGNGSGENNNFWSAVQKELCRGGGLLKFYFIYGETNSRKRSFFAVYSLIMHILNGKGEYGFSIFQFFFFFSIQCKLISKTLTREYVYRIPWFIFLFFSFINCSYYYTVQRICSLDQSVKKVFILFREFSSFDWSGGKDTRTRERERSGN